MTIAFLNRENIPVLYSVKQFTRLCLTNNKIFGLLARGVPASINTGKSDIGNLKGKYGESVIGSLLNVLALENKDLFVFHSVANPITNRIGETDHVVLYKNKLILIETKTYNGFRSFKVNKQGELRGRRVDQPKSLRKLDNNNLIEKVELFTKVVPEDFTVHAITAIIRSGVETVSENGKYKVASLENFIPNIDYHIRQAIDVDENSSLDIKKLLASYCLQK